MLRKRKIHSPEIKLKAALEALQRYQNNPGEYQIHPAQLSQWKKPLISRDKELFQDKRAKQEEARSCLVNRYYLCPAG